MSSICPISLGYNFPGQNKMPAKYALVFSALKVADYIPLVSIISGMAKIFFAGLVADEVNKEIHRTDWFLLLGRGVVSTLQLGIIFLPIDIIMTIVNGVLHLKADKKLQSKQWA